jgi:hypothetical protein
MLREGTHSPAYPLPYYCKGQGCWASYKTLVEEVGCDYPRLSAAAGMTRSGDMEAPKTLPQLSQALLAAAAGAATSRQELSRMQAQTAVSPATRGLVGMLGSATPSNASLLSGAGVAQTTSPTANDNGATTFTVVVEDLRS